MAAGRSCGARTLFENVLSAQRCTLGPEHPHTITMATNLAVCLLHLDPEQGVPLLLETLETAERAHPDLPETVKLRAFVGQLRARFGPDAAP